MFFNSINGDRRYLADNWAAYFASFIGNGVFPVPSYGLQILAGDSGLNVVVRIGKGWINGYFYVNTTEKTITLPNADFMLNRIDRIVLRWDLATRDITAQVKIGVPSSTPTPPQLQRDADAYELCLGDVFVGIGATGITQANITDRRWNTELCGVVKGVVDQIDPSFITAQFDAFFAEYKTNIKAAFAAFLDWITNFKIDSQDTIDDLMIEFLNWANEQKTLSKQFIEEITNQIKALETQSFTFINNDFDADWVKRGCEHSHDPDNYMHTYWHVIATGMLLAERITSYPTGEKHVVTKFYPWETEENGNRIMTTAWTQTRITDYGTMKTRVV